MSLVFDPSYQYGVPVLALCGFSGSGKTTLLEATIPHLVSRGLSVAVVKHDAHGAVVDTPGKDSDRLFQVGATVVLRAPNQQFQRRGEKSLLSFNVTLADLARDHDLILVEGHKDTPLPKFWLEDSAKRSVPDTVTNVVSALRWDIDRLSIFLSYLNDWLPRAWRERPIYRGLLVGGQSSRIGSPEQPLKVGGRQLKEAVADALHPGFADRNVVILGTGPTPESLAGLPQLPNAPGFEGPYAGLLAGHRWAPSSPWIVAACDDPFLASEDIEWLISLRQPGIWAIFPRQEDGHPSTTFALYEPQALVQLERSATERGVLNLSIAVLLEHPRTLIADPPERRTAWNNVRAAAGTVPRKS